jgi:transcriptional regulator with XRE-family HTH domain
MSGEERERERRLHWVRSLRLREVRERKGLSQGALSREVGYSSQSYASKIERGETGLTVTDAERWAEVCGYVFEFRMRPTEGASTVDLEVDAVLAPTVERLQKMQPEDRALVAEVVELLPTLRGFARRRLEEDARAWREEFASERAAEAIRAFAASPAAARLTGDDAAALTRLVERAGQESGEDDQRRKRSR